MAAILIVAGLAIADKVEKKKEKKRKKKADDAARYRELQIETNRRLSRHESGNVIQNTYEEQDEGYDDELQSHALDGAPPPAYEDAVQTGERRERQWYVSKNITRSTS